MHFLLKICSVLLIIVMTFLVPTTTKQANAFFPGGFGGLVHDPLQTIQSTASAIADTNLFTKENLLDGIAWSIAKNTVSQMMQSMIDWVNSGFAGSPAFVTDIEGMLMSAADQAAGEYIQGLGEVGEFLCSPFSLDVQVALSLSFAAARSNATGDSTAAQCTLTDIEDNLEGFLNGTVDSWEQWLQVTTNPNNTPYGAYLAAEQEMYARIQNEQGQILTEATWGDGFLSKKICEAVEGTYVGTNEAGSPVYSGEQYGQTQGAAVADPSTASRSGANCIISTPGQVISQQLNDQLGLGSKTLVEADEINELISAFLNQVTLQAVQGINGLLGLSSGTGYTDTSYEGSNGQAFTDSMVADQIGLNLDLYEAEINASLDREIAFLALIDDTIAEAEDLIAIEEIAITSDSDNNDSDSEERIDELEALQAEARGLRPGTSENINQLRNIRDAYEDAVDTSTSTAEKKQQDAVLEYVGLLGDNQLITQAEFETYKLNWGLVIDDEF